MKLIDLLRNQQVHFKYFRDSALWYETDNGFLFPVPTTETGTATIPRDDKAIHYMKWIREYKEKLEAEKTAT